MDCTALPSQADRVRRLFDSAARAYAREREQEYSFRSQKKIVLEMLQGSRGRCSSAAWRSGASTPPNR
jgi:hypothetical protein